MPPRSKKKKHSVPQNHGDQERMTPRKKKPRTKGSKGGVKCQRVTNNGGRKKKRIKKGVNEKTKEREG